MSAHVVIAGGGPVGLWLAIELRLGGIDVTVLEQRDTIDPHSKALTIHPRTLELLASRGLESPWLAEGLPISSGHFGGLDSRMDFSVLDTPFPFTLLLPQARTEALLQAAALAAGARIRRGHRVIGLKQDSTSVTVQVEGPSGVHTMEADYLVGCDGTRSTVRAAAGIDFPGTDSTVLGWLADVTLAEPPPQPVIGQSGPDGAVMILAMPGGGHRLVGAAPQDVRPDWPGELDLEEVRTKTVAILGRDFGMRDPIWLSRFGNATRQAARYRNDRVLLAGDAAHQHFPTGGVGLNVGVQDAGNLGWKLAATLNGWAPDGLLDSYHDERHPVGAELLRSSLAQTALMVAFSPQGLALRSLLSTLIVDNPELSADLAGRLSALAVRYPATDPNAHPLVGRRAPDLALDEAPSRLFTALVGGGYVLLDFTSGSKEPLMDGARPTPRPPCPPGTTVRRASGQDRDDWSRVRAALIRPDGYVAWASNETSRPALLAAVRRALAASLNEKTG